MAELVDFQDGKVICGRWKVHTQLGAGGCGAVYKVEDLCNKGFMAAMKVESNDVGNMGVLKLEVQVLGKLKDIPDAFRLYDMGKRKKYSFMVMSLGGQDLLNLAMRSPKTLSLPTIARIGVMCLSAIKSIHDVGFVHRDVKPGNFVQGCTTGRLARLLYLIDFGLIRAYMKEGKGGEMKMRKARTTVALRGTFRYCSLNTHNRLEQGRVDDLYSLLHVLQAINRGLPWDGVKDEKEIMMKKAMDPSIIFKDAPAEFVTIAEYLMTLSSTDKPDYMKVYKLLFEELERTNVNFLMPYEWETKRSDENTMVEPSKHERKTFQKDSDEKLQYRIYPQLNPKKFADAGVQLLC
ncbi:hypothetical protein PFISCL1PPCAC_9631 [Pristionchus fissidentatus]|uniref:Protein kinase domain-containing protein n=1 Tax=Pristionchus fissidentatus TaxID=1538716 RepID=A0AAV5VFY5_9BILA|nr:hypothetical protein PFISCL1PPCAC_9631 [Pristionchus fissidentatus]